MGSATQRGGLRRLVLDLACALATIASASALLAGPGASVADAAPLTWSASPGSALSAKGPLHLSCASGTLCVAVDAEGGGLVSSDPTVATASWAPIAIDKEGHELTGVACPSASLCVAVDNAGNALVSAAPTTGNSPWTPHPIDAGHELAGISCPSASLCVAVDNAGNVSVSTTPSTGKWTSRQIDGSTALKAVSCSSASLCVAVDEAGNALASSDPAGGNAWASHPIAYEGAALLAVSCEAKGACTALDQSGYALTSTNPAAQSTGPGTVGPTWSATQIDTSAQLTGVSCVPTVCVAIDKAGNSLASESAIAMPSQWSASAVGIAAETSLEGISCIASSVCVAVAAPASTKQRFQAFTAPVPQPVPPPPPVEAPPSLPEFSPKLSGTPAVGQTLTCEPGLAPGTTATISYQWTANTNAIAGATNPKLKLKGKFEGEHIRCSVTATNAAGSVTKTTSYVSIPSAKALAAVGETKVSKASTSKSGVSFTVECSPRAVGSCTIEAKLTAFERLRGTKVLAVLARRPRKARAKGARTARSSGSARAKASKTQPPKARERTLTATLGSLKLQIKPGHARKMNVPLNAAGKKLLAQRSSLPATLTINGTVIGVLTSKLSEARVTLKAAAKATKGHRATRASRNARPSRRSAKA